MEEEEEEEGGWSTGGTKGGRAGWRWRRRRTWRGLGRVGPGHVHGGDVEGHSFEPQHHEEPLGEGAVPDALAIAPRLHKVTHTHTHTHTQLQPQKASCFINDNVAWDQVYLCRYS